MSPARFQQSGGAGSGPETPLDRIVASLRDQNRTPEGRSPPAAILWTDPAREWEALIPTLQSRMPELLALGAYDPSARTGPAIWLRCVVDGTLEIPDGPLAGATPVLYLPDVKRDQLRAGEACPEEVRPLVELMYRGTHWHHPNGRDWTVQGFLGSPSGTGLNIAADQETTEALLGALGEVALTPLERLRGRRLDADDFNRMLVGDFRRDLLRWMGDPQATRARLADAAWAALRSQCQDELDFDPETEADVTAGARLGEGRDGWADVWDRFAEAPENYPGIEALLARSRPAGELPFDRERWPDLNDEDEATVREALAGLPQRSPDEARAALRALEQAHGPRRNWVWAALGHSPMAAVLGPLARLAEATHSAIGGQTPNDIAATYADIGWRADAAAREAVATAGAAPTRTAAALAPTGADTEVVAAVVRHLLESWLGETATALQDAVERTPLPCRGDQARVEADEDECLVFVDGLRYELGRHLAERLEARGREVSVGHRWAAIPTVTATAKPAVTPMADLVEGADLTADFQPSLHMEDEPVRPAKPVHLRKGMGARGYQIVGDDTLDLPLERGARGWLETGKIDKFGHDHDAVTFARRVDEELDQLADRIAGLLDAGWRSVRIVTDHGWLWLPGGLPMVTLPKHLTESQWSRCAVVSGESTPNIPRHPWHWNESEWFATPPGIACFSKRDEYAHGGLSPQECLIPDIRVTRSEAAAARVTIRSITWRRFFCLAEIEAAGGTVTADLRLGSASGDSVAETVKPVQDDGSVTLLLADDEHEGAALVLVVTDAEGRVLSQRGTRTGEHT